MGGVDLHTDSSGMRITISIYTHECIVRKYINFKHTYMMDSGNLPSFYLSKVNHIYNSL